MEDGLGVLVSQGGQGETGKLDKGEFGKMRELGELRNFINTWRQQHQEKELHESFANRLYECKPVKRRKVHMGGRENG